MGNTSVKKKTRNTSDVQNRVQKSEDKVSERKKDILKNTSGVQNLCEKSEDKVSQRKKDILKNTSGVQNLCEKSEDKVSERKKDILKNTSGVQNLCEKSEDKVSQRKKDILKNTSGVQNLYEKSEDKVSERKKDILKKTSDVQNLCEKSEDKFSETKKDILKNELNPQMRSAAILTTLSRILNCKVVSSNGEQTTFSFRDKTLKVNALQLPNQLDDVSTKITTIVEVMTVQQLNKVKLAAGCFDRATENLGLSGDSVVQEVCIVLAEYFTNVIIRVIDTDEAVNEIWSAISADISPFQGSVDILYRIGGCSDDPDAISPSLLDKLLQHLRAHHFLSSLLQCAGTRLRSVRRMDQVILQEGRALNALDILLANPLCGDALGRVLEEELKEAANGLGNFFEQTSIFGPLLALTTVPDQNSAKSAPFLELRGFPQCALPDIRLLESTIQQGFQRCQNIVFTALKKVLTNKTTREVALAWLAAAINLNEIRTNWTDSYAFICCNDGFMLNFCSVLIELFLPAVTSPELLTKVDLGYSASDSCRLNFSFEICLAGGQIVSEISPEKKMRPLDEDLQGKFNFLTECFHLSQRALSIGVIPAILHYNRFLRFASIQLEEVKKTPEEEIVRKHFILQTLMWDVSLINPELVRKISQFYLSQSQLLLKLIDKAIEGDDANRKKLLSRIPEFCVKDMAVWFRFVALNAVSVHRDVLSGLSLSPFVDCCVVLLAHPELMPGPLPASKIVSALGAFVLTSQRQGASGGWGNSVLSDLALVVLTCPSAREGLGGALVRTYVCVNVVEGLDVDKEEFNKFATRAEITLLIRTLWDQVDTRASILDLANTKLFQDFLGSALDTLLYMLHDALGRMANVRKMEAAKDDVKEWYKVNLFKQTDKEKFLRAESLAGHHFMDQANQTLGFLELLTKSEEVAKCFTRPPLNQRAASAISGFLESLCGPKCKDFKVKNMENYQFDPYRLVYQIVSVILRIAEQDASQSESFVVSMATDADFSPSALEKALSVLSRTQIAQAAELETFAKLIETMKAIHSISKKDDATRTDNSTDWQEAVDAVAVDVGLLMETYQSTLSPLRFGATDLLESHSFQVNAQDSDPGAAKVKALMKEMKQLGSNLPVHPDAAIIVRQDEERINLMRALVTGPVDTPYSRGCFLFDVYFPNNYPNIPPLLKIITTGNGTVRFNPNLYSDGKVCLSLLGTWHAGNASEKWIPSKSSLYQVLVSIQSLILIPDPMFNEPGYEGMQGTTEGDARSKAYNRKLRLWTVRHAMLGQLRSTPQGFEDLIKQHFTIQKDAVLKQCSDWLKDCEDVDEEKRLRSVVNSLREELAKLGDDKDDKPMKYEVDDDID